MEIIFDTNIIPCVTAFPYLSLSTTQIDQKNCKQLTYENGKYSITIENPQQAIWYIQISVSDQIEESSLLKYSLTVSWEECPTNWSDSCEAEVQEVFIDAQETITFSNEQKIVSFEVTEENKEISILFWEESAATLCAFYQFSSPITTVSESSTPICFENSQKLANVILAPAPLGIHFITFTAQSASPSFSFSLLISSSDCRREICNLEDVGIIEEPVSNLNIPHNNDHFATAFLVGEENKIFTLNLMLENYKNQEILFTIAPRSLIGLGECNYVLSTSGDGSITFQLMNPIPGEWIIFGEFVTTPSSRISISMEVDSIHGSQIIPVEIYSSNEFSISVPPRSWVFYQIIQQKKVSLAVNWELNKDGLIVATQYDSLPSFTNFLQMDESKVIQFITKYEKTEYVGIYNPSEEQKLVGISSTSTNAAKVAQQQEKELKKVENFLGEPDGANFEKGADTRVYIFIWSTVIICGGILLVCLIVLIIWTRKAIIKLKASGAYDALRGKEQQ